MIPKPGRSVFFYFSKYCLFMRSEKFHFTLFIFFFLHDASGDNYVKSCVKSHKTSKELDCEPSLFSSKIRAVGKSSKLATDTCAKAPPSKRDRQN